MKRAKATTEIADRQENGKDGAWDKLFAPLHKSLNQEIAVINGTDGNEEDNTQSNGRKKKGKRSKSSGGGPAWRVSKPFGGRMIDVDPVFTEDEK